MKKIDDVIKVWDETEIIMSDRNWIMSEKKKVPGQIWHKGMYRFKAANEHRT